MLSGFTSKYFKYGPNVKFFETVALRYQGEKTWKNFSPYIT